MVFDRETLSDARANVAKCLAALSAATRLTVEDGGPLAGILPSSSASSFFLLTSGQVDVLNADLGVLDQQLVSLMDQQIVSLMDAARDSDDEAGPGVDVGDDPDINDEGDNRTAAVEVVKDEPRQFIDGYPSSPPPKRIRIRPKSMLNPIVKLEPVSLKFEPDDSSGFNDFGCPRLEMKAKKELKKLVKTLCLLREDPKLLEDYFDGYPASNFGLKYSRKSNKISGEIVLLLMESPVFRHRSKATSFFAKLFDVWEDRMRVYLQKVYQFFSQGPTKKSARKFEIPCYAITAEIVESGFKPFNPFTAAELATSDVADVSDIGEFRTLLDLLKVRPSEMVGRKLPNFLKQAKNRKRVHHGWEELRSIVNPVLNSFSGSLTVTSISDMYVTGTMFQFYFKTLIPTFASKKAFGMVGIVMEEDRKERLFDAVWLARLSTGKDSCRNTDFSSLYNVMTNSLGISDYEIFKNTYSIRHPENVQGYHLNQPQKVWDELEDSMGLDQRVNLFEMEIEGLKERGQHNVLIDLNHGRTEPFTLQFIPVSEFNFSMVNCVAVLTGSSASEVTAQAILNEDVFKLLHWKKRESDPKGDSNKKLPLGLIDMFCSFYGFPVSEINDHIPQYRDRYLQIRNTHSLLNCCRQIMSKGSVVCPHCGKVMENHTAKLRGNAQRHMLKCKLERSNCECIPGRTFKSAKDKRRHMLLNHSEKKYYGCNECLEVFTSQAAVDSHYVLMHGLPGQGETCDLCRKTFQSYNHLRIHRLHHESYLCHLCDNIEIIGRTPFKNHQKNFHGYGVHCEFCGKWHATQFKLDYHIKEHHEDKSYLNN